MQSTFEDMVEFIMSMAPARKFVVGAMRGSTGIGKTAAVHEAARRLGAGKVVTIIASQILPNEVSGITMPVHESKAMEIYDHYRLSSLEDGDILFFDELLEADQSVLSACLTLIESRELMSGRKLPDIQIVAATNDTIKASLLKENIRQRFVWRKFDIDRSGCRQYIIDKYHLDVGNLCQQLVESGNDYNILTPRSLTKMAAWICTADNEKQATLIAKQIDQCWHMGIGTALLNCWKTRFNDPSIKMMETLKQVVNDDSMFENIGSIEELMTKLQALDNWKEIEEALNVATIELAEENETEITF